MQATFNFKRRYAKNWFVVVRVPHTMQKLGHFMFLFSRGWQRCVPYILKIYKLSHFKCAHEAKYASSVQFQKEIRKKIGLWSFVFLTLCRTWAFYVLVF